MTKKLRVALLCGGQSAEHEVSLNSARNILAALDPERYETHLITIDKQGEWHLQDPQHFLAHTAHPKQLSSGEHIALIPGKKQESFMDTTQHHTLPEIDVVFPVLHGPFGEDGSVQGLLKLANIPFVGSDVLGSAIGMDKDVMKRLMRDAGLPIAPFLVFHRHQQAHIDFDAIVNELDLPFFVKPANLGSSVGISKVHAAHEFDAALKAAFAYDTKIIIERFIKGREIECSVLGNERLLASVPGEVIPHLEFYSYEAKYLDEHGASLEIPASLPESASKRIQDLAKKTFTTLCCHGMARVDFFYVSEEEIYVNEINTIPGFTNISMYPQLWQASGISYPELIQRLLDLALERHALQTQLQTELVLATTAANVKEVN